MYILVTISKTTYDLESINFNHYEQLANVNGTFANSFEFLNGNHAFLHFGKEVSQLSDILHQDHIAYIAAYSYQTPLILFTLKVYNKNPIVHADAIADETKTAILLNGEDIRTQKPRWSTRMTIEPHKLSLDDFTRIADHHGLKGQYTTDDVNGRFIIEKTDMAASTFQQTKKHKMVVHIPSNTVEYSYVAHTNNTTKHVDVLVHDIKNTPLLHFPVDITRFTD